MTRIGIWATGSAPKTRRPLVLLLLAAATTVTVAALLAFGAAKAQAYERIDSHCILRVTVPSYESDGYPSEGPQLDAPGETDCREANPYPYKIQLEVGPQVHNANGKWYNTGTFAYLATPPNELGSWDYIKDFGYKSGPVNGHVYQTWDWGADQYTSGSGTATATYESSSFTCGC